jgi:hypothetical protein
VGWPRTTGGSHVRGHRGEQRHRFRGHARPRARRCPRRARRPRPGTWRARRRASVRTTRLDERREARPGRPGRPGRPWRRRAKRGVAARPLRPPHRSGLQRRGHGRPPAPERARVRATDGNQPPRSAPSRLIRTSPRPTCWPGSCDAADIPTSPPPASRRAQPCSHLPQRERGRRYLPSTPEPLVARSSVLPDARNCEGGRSCSTSTRPRGSRRQPRACGA